AGVESVATVAVCRRSMLTCGVRFVKFIGDSDFKALLDVVEYNPYGDDTPDVKLECVCHISKRIETRLRKLE
ncbi:hypothetical protein J6590_097642, partial [Homalodisca vitripennis]